MSAGFATTTIEDATERLIDYRGKTPPKTDTGVRLVTAKVIKGGQILHDRREFISADFYDQWMRRGLPEQYDVLITTEAPLGEVAVLRTTEKIALAQRVILLRADKAKTDPLFLFYALQSEFAQGELKARGTGTTVLGIKQSELRQVRIPIFSLPVQIRIAGILSAYDELIENNQRRIRILEDMARSLYREWFVHFRYPGHEAVPLVDSPLGPIPHGWEIRALDQLITNHIGGGWGKEVDDEKHTEAAWVIRGTDIPEARNNQTDKVPHRFHTPSNLRTRRLQVGDIIFEVSGGSKGQPVGRTLLVSHGLISTLDGGDVICASFCKRVCPDVDGYGSELLYLSFLEGYEDGEIEQFQVQSTGISNFKWTEYLQQVRRVVPPESLRTRFKVTASSLFDQIAILGKQRSNLRNTRDLLLPKLLSGDVNFKAVNVEGDEYV